MASMEPASGKSPVMVGWEVMGAVRERHGHWEETWNQFSPGLAV